MNDIAVGLSTASVYPQNTEAAFRYAAELGYDGVELMVWAEPSSQSLSAVRGFARTYGVPVLAVHAPCLLISQRVWGSDPAEKLGRSVLAAGDLGASTVVVHPPFRWQRAYADGFSEQVAELEDRSGVAVAVENMFPMRARRLSFTAFRPSIDPTVGGGHQNYTLDLSHTATAGVDALELAAKMGYGLRHLHLTDGRGSTADEHLIPGLGAQPCAEICEMLVGRDNVQVVLEVNTQSARSAAARAAMLAQALVFARLHLEVPALDTV